MGFVALLQEALTAIGNNRTRTSLIVLGIVIGVGSVITAVGVGSGARVVITDLIGSFGSRSLIVQPNEAAVRQSKWRYRVEEITRRDIEMINDQADAVSFVTPQNTLGASAFLGGREFKVNIMGVRGRYPGTEYLIVARGRFLSREDDVNVRKVCVLGAELAARLFGDDDCLGRYLDLNHSAEVQVVGILEYEEQSFVSSISEIDTSYNKTLFLPVSCLERVGGSSRVFFLTAEARSEEAMALAQRQIMAVLNKNHGKWEGRHEKYLVKELTDVADTVNRVTATVTTFIALVAGIALVVAGIGIMNIMLVSVKERTREIGTRKALGASTAVILNQFMIEILILCGGGGLLGTGLAVLAVDLITRLSKWPAMISCRIILLSSLLSLATGLVFGLYPANKAAAMDPIEALRHE